MQEIKIGHYDQYYGKPVFILNMSIFSSSGEIDGEWKILYNFEKPSVLVFTDKTSMPISDFTKDKYRMYDKLPTYKDVDMTMYYGLGRLNGYELLTPYHEHWCVNHGKVTDINARIDVTLNELYNLGDCYNRQDLAENIAYIQKLNNQLRRYAVEHGGVPTIDDWYNADKIKYMIAYDYDTRTMRVGKATTKRCVFTTYFNSENAAIFALSEYQEEFRKMFEECFEQLY